MLTSIRKVEFMQRCESSLVMFITVVCVLFLIKIFQRFGMIFRKIVEGEGMSEGQNNQSMKRNNQ